jgi:hypothetical protein
MFHVRHNARPILIKELLEILIEGEEVLSLEDILQLGARKGYLIGTAVLSQQSLKENPLQTARDLGLVEGQRLTLTDLGKHVLTLLRQKPGTWGDVMHALFYSSWSPQNATERCFSWSYRAMCDRLWEDGGRSVDRGQLVSEVVELAMQQFATNRVSFSKDSVRGVLQWLSELRPPVLDAESQSFSRRSFCSPECLVLAMDFLYRSEGVDYQTNLLLGMEKQEIICKFCLLEPTAFDAVLDWAIGQYSFLQQGSRGGWGRYVVLTRQPQIGDFLG